MCIRVCRTFFDCARHLFCRSGSCFGLLAAQHSFANFLFKRKQVVLHHLCRRDGKAITLSHDALLVALVGTAEAVKQAADDKQKAVNMDISITDANTVSLSLSPSKAASSESIAERILSGKAASSSQPVPAPVKGKGKKAAAYAPGTGKRSDLTFLDPMNKADCPPKAIALAAGELILRIREERRRREVGGLAADPPLPTKRMSGGKPGKHPTMCSAQASRASLTVPMLHSCRHVCLLAPPAQCVSEQRTHTAA